MDRDTERRISEFARIANDIMNRIPRPVPSGPTELSSPLQDLSAWEGELLDVRALHHAYNRLPAAVQQHIATSYGLCLDVLERQHRNALGALSVRYRLFADLLNGVGLAPEQIVPDIRDESELQPAHEAPHSERESDPRDSIDSSDGDVVVRPPLRFVPPVNPGDPGDPGDDAGHHMSEAVVGRVTRTWKRHKLRSALAAASLIAMGCVGSFTWQYYTASPPTAPTLAVDVYSTGDGAMSAAVHVPSTDDPAAQVCMRIGDGIFIDAMNDAPASEPVSELDSAIPSMNNIGAERKTPTTKRAPEPLRRAPVIRMRSAGDDATMSVTLTTRDENVDIELER